MTEYKITKEQSQKIIDTYKKVCSGCGGKLEPIETVDNSGNPTHWIGCKTCSKFDNGVPKIIFDIAFDMYKGGFKRDSFETDESSQVSGMSFLIWVIINKWKKYKERGEDEEIT